MSETVASVVAGWDNGALIVRLRGDVDQLRRDHLVGVIVGSARQLTVVPVDVGAVRAMTSVGLRTLAEAAEELRRMGKRVELVRVSNELRQLINAAGVGHLLSHPSDQS